MALFLDRVHPELAVMNTQSPNGLTRFVNAATMVAPSVAPRATTPSARTAPSAALAVGSVIDERYELVRELGRGAMGVVWEARHRVLTKHVALKFLHPHLGVGGQAAPLLARFRYEAQVSARLALNTQHIVAVHDTAMFEGRHYIVMDLATGDSLETHIDMAPMSLVATASLVRQIGDALRVAHREEIVHRDVKPSNILRVDGVTSGGSDEPLFKLTDFGVAKGIGEALRTAPGATRTVSGLSVGSPAYMSPEQVAGEPIVDGDPDRWALAAVAYEALTQRLAFEGSSLGELARNITQIRYVPISEVAPHLPASLDAFFARAFARDKADRFDSIDAMLEAFSLASGVAMPTSLRPASLSFAPSSPSSAPRSGRDADAALLDTCIALGVEFRSVSSIPAPASMPARRVLRLTDSTLVPSRERPLLQLVDEDAPTSSATSREGAAESSPRRWYRYAAALPVLSVLLLAGALGLRSDARLESEVAHWNAVVASDAELALSDDASSRGAADGVVPAVFQPEVTPAQAAPASREDAAPSRAPQGRKVSTVSDREEPAAEPRVPARRSVNPSEVY